MNHFRFFLKANDKFVSFTCMSHTLQFILLPIRLGWFFIFFLNIKKNNALKVVYIPIKYSHQKLDLNLQWFFANLAWKILNKHVLKSPRFCQIWPKYWYKNQTISVFKLGNLILFYGNIINKLWKNFKLKIEPLPHPALPVSNLKCYYSSSNIRIYWKKKFSWYELKYNKQTNMGKQIIV